MQRLDRSVSAFTYYRCCNCTPLASSEETCTALSSVSSAFLYALQLQITVPINAAARRMLIRHCKSYLRRCDSDRAGHLVSAFTWRDSETVLQHAS